MIKFVLSFAALMTVAVNVYAALPPVYESTREYKALLDSPQLTDKLGSGEMIKSIEKEENTFIVKSTKYVLKVDVVYEPMAHPGPANFHLDFHNIEPR